jgi:cytochrome bd-type quinol oxidase subunit 2
MKVVRALLGVLLIVLSLVPGYFGFRLIHASSQSIGYFLGSLLVVVSVTTLLGGMIFVAQGTGGNAPEKLTEAARRSLSALFGFALSFGSMVLVVVSTKLLSDHVNQRAWAACYLTLAILGFSLGALSFKRSFSSSSWQPPPVVHIDPKSFEEPEPFEPPEPKIAELLDLKRKLKEQGRT